MVLQTLTQNHKELSGDTNKLTSINRANELLDEINWKDLLKGDVDQMWSVSEENFMSVMHHGQCIPTVKLLVKSNVPWINKDITKAIRARNLSFRQVKRTEKPEH